MDLREQILAEIERGERVARAAEPHEGQWVYSWQDEEPLGWAVGISGETTTLWLARGLSAEVAEHIVCNGSPRHALRRYAHYRKVLERHRSGGVVDGYEGPFCSGCGWDGEDPRYLLPCPELIDLAEALGLSVDGAA